MHLDLNRTLTDGQGIVAAAVAWRRGLTGRFIHS
jgi:hypothetical protein